MYEIEAAKMGQNYPLSCSVAAYFPSKSIGAHMAAVVFSTQRTAVVVMTLVQPYFEALLITLLYLGCRGHVQTQYQLLVLFWTLWLY